MKLASIEVIKEIAPHSNADSLEIAKVLGWQIIVRKGGQDHFLAVGEGFVEITGQRVAILTDMAIRAADIDEVRAEEARKKAEARIAQRLGDEETAVAQAALMHSLTQLNLKRRHHR